MTSTQDVRRLHAGIYRFLRSMIYNSAELFRTQEIARENELKEQEDRAKEEKELALRIFEKADQAYIWFKDSGSLLTKIGAENLKHLVRFLYHVKKTKGNTFSRRSGSKKRCKSGLQGASCFGQATLRRLSPTRPRRSRLKAGSKNQTLKIICIMKMKTKMKISAISLNTKGAN